MQRSMVVHSTDLLHPTYLHTCLRTCLRTWLHTYAHIHRHVYTHVYTQGYTDVHTHVCAHGYTHGYKADWERAAASGNCMAGVPRVFWRCPAVLQGPSTHDLTWVGWKTHTSKK